MDFHYINMLIYTNYILKRAMVKGLTNDEAGYIFRYKVQTIKKYIELLAIGSNLKVSLKYKIELINSEKNIL